MQVDVGFHPTRQTSESWFDMVPAARTKEPRLHSAKCYGVYPRDLTVCMKSYITSRANPQCRPNSDQPTLAAVRRCRNAQLPCAATILALPAYCVRRTLHFRGLRLREMPRVKHTARSRLGWNREFVSGEDWDTCQSSPSPSFSSF